MGGISCCFSRQTCAKIIAFIDLLIFLYELAILIVFIVDFNNEKHDGHDDDVTTYHFVIVFTIFRIFYIFVLISLSTNLFIAAYRRDMKKCRFWFYCSLLIFGISIFKFIKSFFTIFPIDHYVLQLHHFSKYDILNEFIPEIIGNILFLLYKSYSLWVVFDFVKQIEEEKVFRPNRIMNSYY